MFRGIMLRRVIGAVSRVASESGKSQAENIIGLRCNAGRPLLITTALGTGILAGAAGLMLGSQPALAACSGGTSGTQTCSGTLIDTNISYSATSAIAVDIDHATIVENDNMNPADGIHVDGNGFPAQVYFTTDGTAGSVTSTTGTAITVVSNGGGVGVNTVDTNWFTHVVQDKTNTISGSSYGIYAAQTGLTNADVNVTIGDDDVTGGVNSAISASNAGTGIVDVTLGEGSTVSSPNWYGVTAHGSGGDVTVTANGTSVTGAAAGIEAGNTTGKVIVDLNKGSANGTGTGGEGIYASTTGGAGTITITAKDGTTVDSTSDDGIEAVSGGTGLIHIIADGTVTAGDNGGDDGITAIGLSGGAAITIDFGTTVPDVVPLEEGPYISTATITAAGNGIEAQTSGTGKITINADGTITNKAGNLNANGGTLQNNESGIWTKQTGTGDIEINTGANNISAGTGRYDYGIYALAAGGNIDITTGTAVTVEDVTTHSGGTITGGDDAIRAQITGGSGDINITTNGKVTSTTTSILASRDAIHAIISGSGTGDINVTNYGTVGDADVSTTGSGIVADITNTSNSGNVTVNVDNSVYADGLYGVRASTLGTGDSKVIVADDVTIDPTGYGAYSYSAGGNASITTNDGDSVTVDASAPLSAYGLYAESKKTEDDDASTPTVSIVTGDTGSVTVNGDNSFGVYAVNSGATGGAATGSVSVDLTGGEDGTSIHVVGDTGIGILASTYDPLLSSFNGAGDVTVKTGVADITVDGGDGAGGLLGSNVGIAAYSDGGKISITTGTGDITVNADSGHTYGAVGIYANGGRQSWGATADGDVVIETHGIIATNGGDGIQAYSHDGDLSIDTSAAINATGDRGIYADADGTGDVTITTHKNGTISGDAVEGIVAETDLNATLGNIKITTNDAIGSSENYVGDKGITANVKNAGSSGKIDIVSDGDIYSIGLGISANSAGSGKITVTGSGAITTDSGGSSNDAISAISTGTGDVDVGSEDGYSGLINAGHGDGIVAKGYGNVNVKTASTGDIQTAFYYGIFAQTSGLTGAVTVTTDGTVDAGNSGILAKVNNASGTGNIIVDVEDTVTSAGGFGVEALTYGTGTIHVTTNADVTGYAHAISASSTTGGVTIDNDASAKASNGSVVDVVTTGGTVQINNHEDGNIEETGAGPSPAVLAIKTVTGTGSVNVQNDGNITGRVDFDLSSTGGATFNNTSNTWYTDGVNNFTGGNDTLSTTSTGDIHAGSEATFAFGAGTDRVDNAGHFYLTGDTVFTGLENFDNSGSLDLSDDNLDTVDTVTIDGLFTGSGSSTLVLDAYLGGTSMQANTADRLIANGGTAGSTAIRIVNLASGPGSYLGPDFADGILVVSGATSASDFALDTTQPLYNASKEAVDPGLFAYKLVHNGSEERLISLPDDEAAQLPAMLTAAQGLWYETSPWLDRQADLRDQLNGGEGKVTPGIWGKALGHWTSRNTSQTVTAGGTTMTDRADYNQNTYGFVVGADTGGANVFGKGDTLLGGVSAGYVTSDQDFKSSPTTAKYKGAVLGAYATYLTGGFFVDATVKADLLTVDYSAPSLSGATASPDVKTFGVELDAGQRFPLSTSTFIEPLASLTYAKTSIDSFSAAGASFDFKDANSFRGSLGLRGGTTAYQSSATRVDVSLTGRVWDEFDGENKVTITSGGGDVVMQDKFDGAFGEVVGSVNVFGLGGGWSGFVNGGVKFKSDYTSGELTAGVRYEW